MSKIKLVLINPYLEGKIYAPTLGLGFLGTFIRDNSNCKVEIVEPIKERMNQKMVLQKVKKADFVGLTCYTESRHQCFDFAEKIKQENSDCKLLVGGVHATALDKDILRHYPFIDMVIRNEGEFTLLDIINGKSLKKILGLTFRDNDGRIKRNPDRTLIKNIDNLYYDYSLLPEIFKWKDFEVSNELYKRNHLPFIASRGCWFNCAFCGTRKQWFGCWRGKSPEKVVDEMEFLVNKYKIGYFRFYDALFIGHDKNVLKFCNLLKERKLDISFRIDIRVGTKRETLKKLKEVGCDVVGFGIESGSNRILKRINKGITVAQINQTIKNCKELGYWMIGFFMISHPSETKEDMKKTFSFFKEFENYNLQFFKIHPNTPFYEELKQKGEINDEIWFDKTKENFVFYCKDNFPSAKYSAKEIISMIDYSYFNHNITHPFLTMKRYGLRSLSILPISLAINMLLSSGFGKNIYHSLRRNETLKSIYQKSIRYE